MVGYCESFPSLARYGVLSMSRGSTLRHAQTAEIDAKLKCCMSRSSDRGGGDKM